MNQLPYINYHFMDFAKEVILKAKMIMWKDILERFF